MNDTLRLIEENRTKDKKLLKLNNLLIQMEVQLINIKKLKKSNNSITYLAHLNGCEETLNVYIEKIKNILIS